MYEASLKEKLSDSGLLRAFENRQFEKWDYENVLASAMREEGEKKYAEGKREGKQEGKIEGKIETARKMKDGGLSIRQIAEFTGLSIEEIQRL